MIRGISLLWKKHRDAPSNILGKCHIKYHINAEEERLHISNLFLIPGKLKIPLGRRFLLARFSFDLADTDSEFVGELERNGRESCAIFLQDRAIARE